METKSKEMVAVLNEIAQSVFGVTRTDALGAGVCVSCNRDASVFSDAISQREFQISGLCQTCQDEIFSEPDDDFFGQRD